MGNSAAAQLKTVMLLHHPMPVQTRRFSGVIGKDYDLHEMICPNAVKMAQQIGRRVSELQEKATVVDIGCGSGKSTLHLLEQNPSTQVIAIDHEPVMLSQAEERLETWLDRGRVELIERDALEALQNMGSNSIDCIISVYAIHNMLAEYRNSLISEIYRVLVDDGFFLNGDRYALDDYDEHMSVMQREADFYIQTFLSIGRSDLISEWIQHLISDENPLRIMRESESRESYRRVGFRNEQLLFREEIDALIEVQK